MTSTVLRSMFAALVCAAATAFAGLSDAATIDLKAELTAANEVPPNDSKANGTVTATFDTATRTLTWKGSYSGLSGAPFAAHLHSGEAGKNGGIAIAIFAGDTAKSPFEGSATLTDAQVADLMAGKLYVNIHTATHKAGEIRGQLLK